MIQMRCDEVLSQRMIDFPGIDGRFYRF